MSANTLLPPDDMRRPDGGTERTMTSDGKPQSTLPRDVILDALRRAKVAGESHEMTARWIMEDLHRAGFTVARQPHVE
jgi:hypothetical protein